MILRAELREEADRYLERPNGAHTAATCNDGLWAFSREELVDLLEEFGVYAITLPQRLSAYAEEGQVMSTEPQPNTELRERARQFAKNSGILRGCDSILHPGQTIDPLADWQKELAYHFAAAFASSIQAEARQQIEQLAGDVRACVADYNDVKRERDELLRERKTVIGIVPVLEQERDQAIAKRDEFYAALKLAVEDKEAAEKQLAEARRKAFREAAEMLRQYEWIEFPTLLAAALERAAEEKPKIPEAFEIHNRFCGENGEPCQVCKLKAEREEKK